MSITCTPLKTLIIETHITIQVILFHYIEMTKRLQVFSSQSFIKCHFKIPPLSLQNSILSDDLHGLS